MAGGTAIYMRAVLEACRQAVTDHRPSHDITAEIHPVDWTAVWWRKPSERQGSHVLTA